MANREGVEFMGELLPEPIDAVDAHDLVWKEFRAQFAQYCKGARNNRRAYQISKVSAIVIGAAVTVCAAVGVIAWLTATLAAGRGRTPRPRSGVGGSPCGRRQGSRPRSAATRAAVRG